jgi:hypothetical protein
MANKDIIEAVDRVKITKAVEGFALYRSNVTLMSKI